MRILVNDENVIVAFATVGGFEGDIEISDHILPDTFIAEFKNGKFLYIDGQVLYNRDYENPHEPVLGESEKLLREKIEVLQIKADDFETRILELETSVKELLNNQSQEQPQA